MKISSNIIRYVLIVLVSLVLGSGFSFAQNSQQAASHYQKAQKLLADKNYDSLVFYYSESIKLEQEAPSIDQGFLAKCYNEMGVLYSVISPFKLSYVFRYMSLGLYDEIKDSATSKFILRDLNKLANQASDSNVLFDPLELKKLETEKRYIFLGILNPLDLGNDSFSFILDGGSNSGVTVGTTGTIRTTFASNRERANKEFGSFYITEVGPFYSKGIALRKKSIAKQNIKLEAGDNAGLYAQQFKSDHHSLIRQVSDFNITLLDNGSLPYFHPTQAGHFHTSEKENLLLRLMLYDIKTTARSLYDPEKVDIAFKNLYEKIEHKRFKGLNAWEAMLNSTPSDLRAFFRYLLEYPAPYLGRQLRLDEAYAYWLINNLPNSDQEDQLNESKYLFDQMLEQEDSVFNLWLKENKYYLLGANGFNKMIIDSINYLIDKQLYEQSDKLIDLYTLIALECESREFEISSQMSRAYWYSVNNEKDKAVELYSRLIDKKLDTLNSRWFRARIYHEEEDYKKAILDYKAVIKDAPDFAPGHGQLGWLLIETGKFAQARSYCQRAYDLDSNSVPWTVNLGHTYLLQNEELEGRYYYLRSLDLITKKEDYLNGLVADLNRFIENGWNTSNLELELAFINDIWVNQYEQKVQGQEYRQKGDQFLKNNDLDNAISMYKEASFWERSRTDIDYAKLSYLTAQTAYCHFKLKQYDQSIVLYKNALDLNRVHVGDLEEEYTYLSSISYLYQLLSNSPQEHLFSSMAHTVKRRMESFSSSNDLYLISIGNNAYGDGSYDLAESDAKALFETLKVKGKFVFDRLHAHILLSDELTKASVREQIDNVVRDSRYGDCFVFYYAGYGSDGDILIGDEHISSEEFFNWTKDMRAQKQLILIDAPGSDLSKTFSQLETESNKRDKDILVAHPLGSRLEEPGQAHGALVQCLIKGIEGAAATNWEHSRQHISARELIAFTSGQLSNSASLIELSTYSSGFDFDLIFHPYKRQKTNDDQGPMIIIQAEKIIASRGARSRKISAREYIEGQALDQSGIKEIKVDGLSIEFTPNGRFKIKNKWINGGQLIITAIDNYDNLTSDTFSVLPSSQNKDLVSSTSQRKNFALLIATDSFDNWNNLRNPIRDAEQIAYRLRNGYDFEVEVIKNGTKEEIEEKLLSYMEKDYGPHDQLFLYIAGHGLYDENLAGQLVCKDSKLNDKRTLPTYLDYSFITDNFDRNGCKHVFLALDVCFGGAYFDQKSAPKYSDSDLERISIDEFANRKAKYKSRQFLASGPDEVPDGSGNHSPFAIKFIETLESGEEKGYVTLIDFVDHMRLISTETRYGSFGSHHPDGDFIFKYNDLSPEVKEDQNTNVDQDVFNGEKLFEN